MNEKHIVCLLLISRTRMSQQEREAEVASDLGLTVSET
jgi:hypothetical protein